jgi:D-alanyl-D-alanine carboxypeptidase/D-alanyl-D-alanine-endopeptidase (penicillin-binding protein 4)
LKKIIFSILILIPQASFAITPQEFQDKLKQQVGKLSASTNVSMHFEVLGKNQVLFSHNSDLKLYPASNTKLLSAMAALEKLGPGFTFSTKVYSNSGDLILQGNGDPYLVSERI